MATRTRDFVGRNLLPAALLTAAWAVLTSGALSSWVIGVPVVILGACAAAALGGRTAVRIRPAVLASFVPFFLWRSLTGAVDVSWRALRPSRPIAPSEHMYRLTLPAHGPARVLFANVLSLLPGTIAADLDGERVTIHALSGDAAQVRARAAELERQIASLLGFQELLR